VVQWAEANRPEDAARALFALARIAEVLGDSAAELAFARPQKLGGAEHEVVSFLEATGKREQAVSEFREFLSRFEGSPTRLPQVAEARAPLKRLGAL
jgi:DNA/RNA-binding domain of Phe-tRNA-synthetase-like protein